MNDGKVVFAVDVRPLFRDSDIAAMKKARHFDLSSYSDVCDRAQEILERLQAGDMPCDGPWPATQIQVFSQWIQDGKLP